MNSQLWLQRLSSFPTIENLKSKIENELALFPRDTQDFGERRRASAHFVPTVFSEQPHALLHGKMAD
jgi:hypothetical protein